MLQSNQKIIRHKVGLLNLAEELGNVSKDLSSHGPVHAIRRKRGVFMSPSGVRGIWLRHDLAHFKARLKALEAKVAEEGIILTEAQIQALEKKKLDDCGLGRDRHRASRLSWLTGYILCRHPEGRRPGLSADLYRYIRQGRRGRTLQNQNPDHGSRHAQ